MGKSLKSWEPGEVSGETLGAFWMTVEEVMDVLKCMNVDKSPCPDQGDPNTLREAREESM